MERIKQVVNNKYLKYGFIWFSFIILDIILRFTTMNVSNGMHGISAYVFTILYASIFVLIINLISNIKIKKVVYGILYYLFLILMIVQYGAQFILNKFLFIQDMFLAKEGMDYTNYVLSMIDLPLIISGIVLIAIGVIGIILLDKQPLIKKKSSLIVIALMIVGIIFTPNILGSVPSMEEEGFYDHPAYVYDMYQDSNRLVHIAGMYQYTFNDAKRFILKENKTNEDQQATIAQIDDYFEKRGSHEVNDYSGIYKGKNVIVMMMESIDDFVITKEDTPTLYKMMNEGINFTKFYTPDYAVGYTFNTEFAFNTATYPLKTGDIANDLVNNNFNESIANIFKRNGYNSNSFHFNEASFYNRGEMHETFGYEKYHSYQDYPLDSGVEPMVDTFLPLTKSLMDDMVNDEPFYSFNITYSTHLPYDEDEYFAAYALSKYPQYKQDGKTSHVNVLKAKAVFTDRMFELLLEDLEKRGILDDTVIVCFADHYAYGVDEDELKQQLQANDIYERTPAFIYCSDEKVKVDIDVDKVAQTIDLMPTILNLLGIDVPNNVMGRDIFDPNYEGYAIFPDQRWLSKDVYYKNNEVVWGDDLTQEEISELNTKFQKQQVINDMILESNYYNY